MREVVIPVNASVWRLGPGGRMLSNLSEENAAKMAADDPSVIYFFAELNNVEE